MANKLDHEKINRRRSVYKPDPVFDMPSQSQIDYFLGLHWETGTEFRPDIPQTKGKIGRLIDHLKTLPRVREPAWFTNGRPSMPIDWPHKPTDKRVNLLETLATDLRERFPQLTPMRARNMVSLLSDLDELGMVLTFETLDDDAAPKSRAGLVIYILGRFLEAFGDVTEDGCQEALSV